jgi:hypothetical protein
MAKWLTNARAEGGKMPRSEIDEYQAAADATLGSFIGRFDGQPPPNTIYHYTDDRGLRGIIESGKLWFTDIFDLNDPSELRHGFSFAVKALDGPRKIQADWCGRCSRTGLRAVPTRRRNRTRCAFLRLLF